jgi:hypothetical protein
MYHIILLFVCTMLICMVHYVCTYIYLCSEKTLHLHFHLNERKQMLSSCLMKMNAMVCCDDCHKIIHDSNILTMPTGTTICPSVGVVVNGVFTAMKNLIDFECFCNQCHELQ